MIGETCRSKDDFDQAFKYYLKGIESEPTFNENYVGLSVLCRDMGEIEISNVIIIFGKAIQQVKQMDKILNQEEDALAFKFDELIFEEAIDEERSQVYAAQESDYNQLEDEQLPEIRIKQELHSLLIEDVCVIKDRIQRNTIEFKLLRAIHILQRLIEKLINEIQSRAIMANHGSMQQSAFNIPFEQVILSQASPMKLRLGNSLL